MPAAPIDKSSIHAATNNYTELRIKDSLSAAERKDHESNNLPDNRTLATAATPSTANSSASVASTAAISGQLDSLTLNMPSAQQLQQQPQQPAQTMATTVAQPQQRRSAHDYRFGKAIGEGSFSSVYLAQDIHTRREYAIKVCDKQNIIRNKKQEYVQREREVLHRLSSAPGFVTLHCTFQDYRSLYFVMSYARNKDLLHLLRKVGSFDVRCTRHYAAELLLSLEHMHSRGIIHRDLKPENILIDDTMHTLICDFGTAKILGADSPQPTSAAASAAPSASPPSSSSSSGEDIDEQMEQRRRQKRRSSFVGTSQYVSPEILKGQSSTPASDLWALGCIVYQMLTGVMPFRGGSDFLVFQKILSLDLAFPDDFDACARDLVEQLLRHNPRTRLGATDAAGFYASIRAHPFFAGVDWEAVRTQTPPSVDRNWPGSDSSDDDDEDQYRVPDHLETGLDQRQLTRMLGMELGTAMPASLSGVHFGAAADDQAVGAGLAAGGRQQQQRVTEQITVVDRSAAVRRNLLSISPAEREQRIEAQRRDNKWHQFVGDEVILKQGFINKRKGLFARKRMFLLTTGPRLVYVDPVNMVRKGEIPWSSDIRVEPRNFKIFFVHTPNRTYYLEDTKGFALEWCDILEQVRDEAYGPQPASPVAYVPPSRTNSA